METSTGFHIGAKMFATTSKNSQDIMEEMVCKEMIAMDVDVLNVEYVVAKKHPHLKCNAVTVVEETVIPNVDYNCKTEIRILDTAATVLWRNLKELSDTGAIKTHNGTVIELASVTKVTAVKAKRRMRYYVNENRFECGWKDLY